MGLLTLNKYSVHRINKLIPILIILIVFCKDVYAQQEQIQDSIMVDDREERWSYKYLDVNDFEQKLIFKIAQPLGNSADYGFTSPGKISLEAKLSPIFSIEGGYIFSDLSQDAFFGDIRYYFNKNRKSGGINNFVGTYLMVGLNRYFGQDDNINYYPGLNSNIFHVGTGYQGKVGKYGYYNATALVNYNQERKTVSFSVGADVGFGYGRLRKPLGVHDEFKIAPSLINKRAIFKVSDLGFYYGETQKGIGINIGYEVILLRGLTLFGLLQSGASEGRISNFSTTETVFYKTARLRSDLELRYYYNQKSRLKRGKNGSSFNGPYVMMGIDRFYSSHDRLNFFLNNEPSKDRFFNQSIYKLAWGYQQLIGKRGFIDFNIGPGYNLDDGIDLYSNVKIGLRF